MNEIKNIKFIVIICIVTICIAACFAFYYFFLKNYNTYPNKDQKCKYVVFFNRYNLNGSNRKALVYYFDQNLNLIYVENFKPKDYVPNQIMINDKIYSYGYGGIYQTDITNKETNEVNTAAPINIVKYDSFGNIYTYQNYGFSKKSNGVYISKILKNNEKYIELHSPIVDFCVSNDIFCVTVYSKDSLEKGKILVYKAKNQISEYDIDLKDGKGNWAVYNNDIFFLQVDSALKIDQDKKTLIPYEGIDRKIIRPSVINNMDFSKLYIMSSDVSYKDKKLLFKDHAVNYIYNYNPTKDSFLECSFDKKSQILTLKGKKIQINQKPNKYKYIFSTAFEI